VRSSKIRLGNDGGWCPREPDAGGTGCGVEGHRLDVLRAECPSGSLRRFAEGVRTKRRRLGRMCRGSDADCGSLRRFVEGVRNEVRTAWLDVPRANTESESLEVCGRCSKRSADGHGSMCRGPDAESGSLRRFAEGVRNEARMATARCAEGRMLKMGLFGGSWKVFETKRGRLAGSMCPMLGAGCKSLRRLVNGVRLKMRLNRDRRRNVGAWRTSSASVLQGSQAKAAG